MEKHFNGLSPLEAERLAIVAEECAEVIQVIGKILRHGLYSKHPKGGPLNYELLEKEMGDVQAAFDMALNDIIPMSAGDVERFRQAKHVNVRPYIHHKREDQKP